MMCYSTSLAAEICVSHLQLYCSQVISTTTILFARNLLEKINSWKPPYIIVREISRKLGKSGAVIDPFWRPQLCLIQS